MMYLRNMLSAQVEPNKRVEVSRAYLALKLAVEWALALLLLAVLAPLLVALAILVKCSSTGPAFYSQTRMGRSGRSFRIYKLRTMINDCEAVTGPVWSIADDPRVTSIGRWLRDTHLDEIPQLINVLRGEMALIGPRPERPEIAARIENVFPEFQTRLCVRPGITGLAQMRMPADTDLNAIQRKLAHDMQYISHLGPAMDMRILLSTFFYFLGAAARATSRQLVQPYAPAITEPPLLPAQSTLTNSCNEYLSFAA